MTFPALQEVRIGVIGLGYVGLPLAVEFSKYFPTVGFDINLDRIKALSDGRDITHEVSPEELSVATQLSLTTALLDLVDCQVYIVTVPTPLDEFNRPDLSPLALASTNVGEVLTPGNVVIYESTVYPGATEEFCVPILEAKSQLRFNQDFYCGYSPERINPGDKEHRLTSIVKITSGSTPETAHFVDALYRFIVKAGTHQVSSIKVAEAAKVIENTQRDVNIALVNEFAIIFNKLGINTLDVLAAAETKWNFLPFRPGLVGGHCIGVDPYYLTHKAQQVGYHPEVILSGRRVNDQMGSYAAQQLILQMAARRMKIVGARILVLGLTFKENCPDIRNTRVVDLIDQLQRFGTEVEVYDPWVAPDESIREYGIEMLAIPQGKYEAIVIAVAHEKFKCNGLDWRKFLQPSGVIYDVKGILPSSYCVLHL